ncbi:MAG TPA: NAD-dependent epimerase/dehydratase family protein [Verrucomicrobiae bacterium]|jgi:UDP-glucuronate decarboxylase
MASHFVQDKDIQEIVQGLGDDVHKFDGKTILMTGGGGFLGRYFQVFLAQINQGILNRPCRLISVDNHITSGKIGRELQVSDAFVNINHDITRPLEINEPVHYIIHAAGIASPYYYRKYPLETLEVATTGTRNMLQLALQKQVECIIFFSSSEIYGDPDPKHVPTAESYRGNVACLGPRACYDESKRVGETLCYIFHNMHGVKTKIIRPFNIYGPGMQETDYRVLPNFASRILHQQPLHIYGQGTQTRTFCYISDAITGFLKVLLLGIPGEAYNIGNDQPEVSMLDLSQILEEVSGRKLQVDLIEYPDAYPADEPMRRCPDLTKARRQLGYDARVQLRDGLRRFMDWAKATYTYPK